MTRSELREHCFKLLFCTDFYPKDETAEQIDQYFDAPVEDETAPEGTEQILHQVVLDIHDSDQLRAKVKDIIEKIPALDREINAVAQGWKTGRMGKVELTVLRLACYEMRYDDQVPLRVAINEAVELAKKFGQADASSFVNGVLARIVTEETEPERADGN